MSSQKTPDLSILRTLNDIFDVKYAKNMMAFYVLHPTVWLKLFFNFFSPFLNDNLKLKLEHVSELKKMYKIYTKEQLRLPQYVFEFDERENGVQWREPELKDL
jgi:hypothetical protein